MQCRLVQSRGRAVQSSTLQCNENYKFNAVQRMRIEYMYFFKTLQWSELLGKEMQCNPMDKNVEQCTAAPPPPPPNLNPKEENNPCMFLSVSVRLSASVERFSVSRMRDCLFIFENFYKWRGLLIMDHPSKCHLERVVTLSCDPDQLFLYCWQCLLNNPGQKAAFRKGKPKLW